MPLALAAWASAAPTFLAAAVLSSSVTSPLRAFEVVAIDTSVRPATSSTSCAYMCLRLLYTVSRGRSGVPTIFLRMRARRFSRAVTCFAMMLLLAAAADQPPHERGGRCRALGGAGLAFLAADDLVRVLDALALVRLGRAQRTDLGGGEAEQVLVHRAHGELGLLGVHLGGHALRQLEDHRVREAEREVDVLALHLGLEADAGDLEAALVALLHALEGVLHQGAGEAVEAAGHAGLVEPGDL